MADDTASDPLNPEAVFRQAVGFSFSARLLGGHQLLRMNRRNPAPADIIANCPTLVPAVVLSAFSIELYLKCLWLLVVGGKFPKIHTMSSFIEKLPAEMQSAIIADFDSAMTLATPEERPLADLFNVKYPDGHYSYQNCLVRMDTAFAKWRYLYEYKEAATEYSGDGAMIFALEKRVLALHPEWQHWIDKSLPNPESITELDPHPKFGESKDDPLGGC